MANFKNLEMAQALSQNQHITIKKSLFGTKALYAPSQSKLEVSIVEYTPTEGERLERLLALPIEKIAAELQAKGKPSATSVGQYRLEAVVSADHQFAAVQLFRFTDFSYNAVSQLVCCEGNEVETLCKLL